MVVYSSLGMPVEPKHKMYLNLISSTQFKTVFSVEPKHKMYLNGGGNASNIAYEVS